MCCQVDQGTDPLNRRQSYSWGRVTYDFWPPHSIAQRMCRRLMAEYRERMRLQVCVRMHVHINACGGAGVERMYMLVLGLGLKQVCGVVWEMNILPETKFCESFIIHSFKSLLQLTCRMLEKI